MLCSQQCRLSCLQLQQEDPNIPENTPGLSASTVTSCQESSAAHVRALVSCKPLHQWGMEDWVTGRPQGLLLGKHKWHSGHPPLTVLIRPLQAKGKKERATQLLRRMQLTRGSQNHELSHTCSRVAQHAPPGGLQNRSRLCSFHGCLETEQKNIEEQKDAELSGRTQQARCLGSQPDKGLRSTRMLSPGWPGPPGRPRPRQPQWRVGNIPCLAHGLV